MKTFRLGSNPSKSTMIIAVYRINDKIYKTTNLKKKLKKIKIDDILYQIDYSGNTQSAESILDRWIKVNLMKSDESPETSIEYYYFKNKITGDIIKSVYDNVDNLKEIINVNEYERIS